MNELEFCKGCKYVKTDGTCIDGHTESTAMIVFGYCGHRVLSDHRKNPAFRAEDIIVKNS